MATLTVTAKGQVTLKKELLQHIGVQPGQQIEVDPLPEGRLSIQAKRPSGFIDAFIGYLARDTDKSASIEEINEAAADGWTGRK